MFDLVSDVASYPQFLPWCHHARLLQKHDDGQTAVIGLSFNGLRQQFSTRNVHVHLPGGVLEDRLSLVDGPFSMLEGIWRYSPVGQMQLNSCKVELHMRYDFDNAAIAALISPVFDRIAASLVDAFVKRAATVYGA